MFINFLQIFFYFSELGHIYEQANIGTDTPKESWDLEKLIAKLQQ